MTSDPQPVAAGDRTTPRLLHFCFGMSATDRPWTLLNYICVRRAVEVLRPDRVLFHTEYEPSGPWWRLTKPLVTVVKAKAPRSVFGWPLYHPAHRADVLRLKSLIASGGIYLDTDVFVHRSFDALLDGSVVMGRQEAPDHVGLCNAVIIAPPEAPFLRRWLKEYKSFDPHGWSEHSVSRPLRLADAHPEEIRVLPPSAFFELLWTEDDLARIFEGRAAGPYEGNLATHLWESQLAPNLHRLTPGAVRAMNSSFSQWSAPYLNQLDDNYGARPLRLVADQALAAGRGTLMRVNTDVREFAFRVKRKLLKTVGGERAARRLTFQSIYRRHEWGDDGQSEFFSGFGSRGEAPKTYVDTMVGVLEAHGRTIGRPISLVDLGCGDFEIGRALTERMPEISYHGLDIVPEMIEHHQRRYGSERIRFSTIDIVADTLPSGDVCLIRQVFQHLSNREISKILSKLDHPHVYITESHPPQREGAVNPDKTTGSDVRFDWRQGRGRGVELDQPPFNCRVEDVLEVFSPPNEIIVTQRLLGPGSA